MLPKVRVGHVSESPLAMVTCNILYTIVLQATLYCALISQDQEYPTVLAGDTIRYANILS